MVDESSEAKPITSALAPNLDAVRRFIVEMVERGSIAMLVSAVRVPDAERTCPRCDVECSPIGGGDVISKLDMEPARFVVREEVCEVLGCPRCHQYIVRADKPDEVVDRGVLGNELLVQATVDHYQDAVPWERMERRARQEGAPLSANTLAQSCGKLVDLFDPIVEHIFEQCVRSSYFALDATGMPVLDISVPIGIRTGALWLLQGDHVYSYFLYAESGHAEHVENKLVGQKLARAMCDGSPTNNLVERAGATRGGCNAHARRKLVEALRCGDERALGGLELYGTLFHIEAQAKRAGESFAQRFLHRQEYSVAVVEQLRRWVDERIDDVEPKSKLGQAVRYMRRQWMRLTEFLRDPMMEPSMARRTWPRCCPRTTSPSRPRPSCMRRSPRSYLSPRSTSSCTNCCVTS